MKKRRLWFIVLSLVFSICICFCLAACSTDGGGNNGKDEDNKSVVDEPVKLGTPIVTVHGDGSATWGAITNASGYVVKIGDGETATTETSAKLKDGETISVQAVGNGTSYLTGDFSAPKTYKAPTDNLAAPENLTVVIQGTDEGNVVLSWNAVDGASGYEYIVNGDEQNAVTATETSATVDLSEIDATKLDRAWTFRVKALGSAAEESDDGDYSDCKGASDYCNAVEFSVTHDEFYTVSEILKIMNYYGEHLPSAEFWVTGTIQSNTNGDAVLENGFTLFGDFVPELYLAIDGKLAGIEVIAYGTLMSDGDKKGLSSYRSVDFENIEDSARYALVIETLYAWDMLKEDSKIMGDFYLPVKLYGVKIDWDVIVDVKDAFVLDDLGNVTVNCPAGGEDIDVMLTATLYINDNNIYVDEEPTFMFLVVADTRTPLDAPKININPNTGVATWNKIEHATGYRVTYYGYSVPGDWYSDYISKDIVIPANGNLSVELKDTWWITVQALGDDAAYKDSDIASKQYNYYPSTTVPNGTPLVFDLTKLTQTSALANPTYIFGLACGNSSVFESATASGVVLGNDDVNGAVTGKGFIKVGSAKINGKITLNFNKKITGVVICARQWDNDQNDKLSVNGSEQQTASKNDWGVTYYNFTASKASTTVEIDTDNRVFIQSITVYVAD